MREIELLLSISCLFEEIETSKNKKATFKKIETKLLDTIEQIKEYDEKFANECIEELKKLEKELKESEDK